MNIGVVIGIVIAAVVCGLIGFAAICLCKAAGRADRESEWIALQEFAKKMQTTTHD